MRKPVARKKSRGHIKRRKIGWAQRLERGRTKILINKLAPIVAEKIKTSPKPVSIGGVIYEKLKGDLLIKKYQPNLKESKINLNPEKEYIVGVLKTFYRYVDPESPICVHNYGSYKKIRIYNLRSRKLTEGFSFSEK